MVTRPPRNGQSTDFYGFVAFRGGPSGYLDFCRVEKGSGGELLAAYGRDLARLAAFLADRGRLMESARPDDLRAFVDSLYAAEMSGRSVARHLSAVRRFYVISSSAGVSEDPSADLSSPTQ
ncbi:MAG: site-specific integrase [Bryobacterales bacterium]